MIFARHSFASANFITPWIIACIGVCLSCGIGLANAEETPESSSRDEPIFHEIVESGELIFDGKVIDQPFEIKAWPDAWTINGIHLTIEVARGDERHFDGGRHRDWRRSGERSGKRGMAQSVRTARRAAEWLNEERTIVAFSGHPAVVLRRCDNSDYFAAILAKTPTKEALEKYEGLCENESLAALWRSNLDAIELSSTQRQRWQQEIDVTLAADLRARNEIAATRRFESFSYVFTVAAMLLGTVALGHMLNWSGKGFGDSSPDAMKACTIAVLLMAALSIVDLLWTIMAAQAGQMTEINPVASQFIDSPLALTALKATSIIVSGGIFFWLRKKQIVQKAAWWMCLVLVLVTFRWAVFGAASL